MPPHSLPFTLLGTGILWFGWFGFNAGSSLLANGLGAQALINTHMAAAAAMLTWLIVERIKTGHATTLGAASGAVAGLVAITPCAGFVGGIAPMIIGGVAGIVCFLAIQMKSKFGYDDSLDVIGVHLVGGLWGTIAIGFLATAAAPAGVDGLFYGGGVDQLWRQVVGALAVLVFSFVLTLIIGFVIQKAIGFRLTEEDEVTGIDNVVHAESGYDFASLGSSGSTAPLAGQARAEARSTQGVGA
jgi:ammonium transporter, Amt family